jgi:hypothetical protein
MKLSAEQQAEIRERYGIRVNEACDKCGQLLGWVRFTRKNEQGEWCSHLCRDGAATVTIRRFKGGRPMKYRNEIEQRRANSRRQREYRTRCNENLPAIN